MWASSSVSVATLLAIASKPMIAQCTGITWTRSHVMIGDVAGVVQDHLAGVRLPVERRVVQPLLHRPESAEAARVSLIGLYSVLPG